MRQRAARNIVYARTLDIFYVLFGDVAATFGERAAAYHFNCLLHIGDAHIVEHNYVGASFQGLAAHIEVFYLHLYLADEGGVFARHLHGLFNAARRADVVIL